VRVQAPPVDGAANAALVRLVASAVEVPPSSVRVVSGLTSRRKLLEIDDVEPKTLRSLWPDLDV
jgi:uncharacterized protein YggU (UPF0235/DUF167 family)